MGREGCACRSAPMDAVLRDLHSTSVPISMALEALVVGAVCMAALMVIGMIDRTKPLDASEPHATHLLPEGGLRYVDVWDSEADWDRFVDERLHPVVHPLLHEIFGDELPPEPPRVALAAIDHWSPDDRRR